MTDWTNWVTGKLRGYSMGKTKKTKNKLYSYETVFSLKHTSLLQS